MADPEEFTLNSEEIRNLLHARNSQLQHHRQPAGGISESIGLIVSYSDLEFRFPSENTAYEETDRNGFALSRPIACDFDSGNERDHAAAEAGQDPESSRSSLKRTRAAEFHNLSEKKRRKKINENLRMLQKFIPNSKKTDKASVLDDAIDYIRHLQLEVQMLAFRNGSFLNPYNMTELHSVNGTQGFSMTVYDPDQYAFYDGKALMPSAHSFCLDPSNNAHCRP